MIDWTKPIQSVTTKKPARLLCADRRCTAYAGKLLLNYAVLVTDTSGTSEICVFVNVNGEAFDARIIENTPPPKLKVPYVVYKTSAGVVFIATTPVDIGYVQKRDNGYTILSEGVMEVEDKS